MCDKTVHRITDNIGVIQRADNMLEVGVGEYHTETDIVSEPMNKHTDDVGGIFIRQRKAFTTADVS